MATIYLQTWHETKDAPTYKRFTVEESTKESLAQLGNSHLITNYRNTYRPVSTRRVASKVGLRICPNEPFVEVKQLSDIMEHIEEARAKNHVNIPYMPDVYKAVQQSLLHHLDSFDRLFYDPNIAYRQIQSALNNPPNAIFEGIIDDLIEVIEVMKGIKVDTQALLEIYKNPINPNFELEQRAYKRAA